MTEWVERNRGFVLVTLINLAALGALLFWFQRPEPTSIQILTPEPAPSLANEPTPTQAPLRVYVAGAVLRPDVYRLAPGSIIQDAIMAAGGATSEADLDQINLAQELRDQQRVYLPRVGQANAPPPVTGGESLPAEDANPTATVDLNTATVEELETLPGIGPGLAQRIVDCRVANGPFSTIEEIKTVDGIGDATFDRIKDRITVGN
jgi:competence protein ComEA